MIFAIDVSINNNVLGERFYFFMSIHTLRSGLGESVALCWKNG